MAKAIMAVTTANIMPTRTISWGSAGLLGLAAVLLSLAIPNFLLRLQTLAMAPITEQLKAGQSLDGLVLDDYIARQQEALERDSRAEFAEQLAMGLTARLSDTDIVSAIAAQQQSLRQAPANPYGWLRLAYLSYQKDGVTVEAAAAWQKSLLTGPQEGRLLVPRLTFGILLMDQLPPSDKARIPTLIRAAYAFDSGGLAKAAYDYHYISVVEAALADEPKQLQRFLQMVGRR